MENYNFNEQSNIKKAFDIIVFNLNSKIGDVTLETGFTEVDIDSITFIKIVVALEREFNIEFDDDMLLITEFPTIISMIKYVESKI